MYKNKIPLPETRATQNATSLKRLSENQTPSGQGISSNIIPPSVNQLKDLINNFPRR